MELRNVVSNQKKRQMSTVLVCITLG